MKLGIIVRGDTFLLLSYNQEINHKLSERICNKLEIHGKHVVHVDTLILHETFLPRSKTFLEGKVTFLADAI